MGDKTFPVPECRSASRKMTQARQSSTSNKVKSQRKEEKKAVAKATKLQACECAFDRNLIVFVRPMDVVRFRLARRQARVLPRPRPRIAESYTPMIN